MLPEAWPCPHTTFAPRGKPHRAMTVSNGPPDHRFLRYRAAMEQPVGNPLATQAQPVKVYHTTIHPTGACPRCKKATIVAELTHPFFWHRHHGIRLFPDQIRIGFPGASLSLAMQLRPCRHRRATHDSLHRFPRASGPTPSFGPHPGDGSSNSSRFQTESPGARLPPAARSRRGQVLRGPNPCTALRSATG